MSIDSTAIGGRWKNACQRPAGLRTKKSTAPSVQSIIIVKMGDRVGLRSGLETKKNAELSLVDFQISRSAEVTLQSAVAKTEKDRARSGCSQLCGITR